MERFSALLLGIYILLIAFIDISKSQRSCPPPNFPENGNYSRKGQKFQPGDIITYFCNEDYLLLGNEESKCKYDGDWSNPTPFCDLKVDLKDPSVISDKGFPRKIPNITDANGYTCYDLKGGEKIEVNLDKKKVLYAVKLLFGPGDTSISISTRIITFKYSNNIEISKWVIFRKNDTFGSTDIVRIQDNSDNKNSTICEIEVYVKEENECENPPKQKVVNGYFKVNRSIATLICQEGYKSKYTRLSCEEKNWKGPTFLCEAEKKSNSRTIIYASVGAVALLIIIAFLGVVIYFVRKQRNNQFAVFYKSTTEGSVISESGGDSTAPYHHAIQNPAPLPPASRPPEILSDGCTLPLDGKDTMKERPMPADIASSSLKQSAFYNY